MEPALSRGELGLPSVKVALVVSEVRFLRDSLTEILSRVPAIKVGGHAATSGNALAAALALRPEIILLDVAFPDGTRTAARLCSALPEVKIIALGIRETEEDVLAWAEAGVTGYVPNTASVEDLVILIGQISRGEQSCPSHIVGGLMRRIAAAGREPHAPAPPASGLTRRESEILNLVGAGHSNKDIARRLSISLGTTKSHVHNLLGKLRLQRRAEVMTRLHSSR